MYHANDTLTITSIANIVSDKYVAGSITDKPLKKIAISYRAFRNPCETDCIFSGTNFANIARDIMWKVLVEI